MQYMVMDATKMSFEDASFDVVIDKACLDAIYAEDNENCRRDATAYLNENIRVLKPDGVLFTISMSQDFICTLLHSSFALCVYFRHYLSLLHRYSSHEATCGNAFDKSSLHLRYTQNQHHKPVPLLFHSYRWSFVCVLSCCHLDETMLPLHLLTTQSRYLLSTL